MQILKASVIAGGVLLAMGATVLLLKIANRPVSSSPTANRELTPSQAAANAFLEYPATGKIMAVMPAGDGVTVWIGLPSGAADLLLLNHQGNLKKRLHLIPATASPPMAAEPQIPKN